MTSPLNAFPRRPFRLAAGLIAAASLAGCAPMPTGGSSSLPSLGKVFSEGLSFSPSVNVARNMEGRSINDAIAALGEPSKKRAVGNTMELEWSDYQTAPYQEWVVTGTSQQVVGMIPASNTTAATPVFQQSSTGYMQNRSRVYECKVLMRMKDSVIVGSTVDGNVCPEFIAALRKWAGENEARNYVVK
ncbi:hypothetical protein LMG3458_04009 [Achromobacter deleyi]|uniref:Uncharacterized protein n=1 Tax=Achromobacter deleyi TaxID=1353891 RepID=A0A6S7A9W3_9BURK|nr:hypothetical protein [Achromobacter deleyi]CAB3721565.1 hypothetical protein LMG3458_04009 [Achromobacter deleyi]CAB3894049.1 hypothetical protein LMG3482_03951 [Achromobacter deleyi]CAB3917495.1 hypothetical protein LMG3481_05126 [Achromobacter deleyi]